MDYDIYDAAGIENEALSVETVDDVMELYDNYYKDQLHPQDFQHDSWSEVYRTCILPSTQQVLTYAALLMGGSILYTFLRGIVERLWPQRDRLPHLISISCGFAVLFAIISWNLVLIMMFVIFGYILVLFMNYHYKWSSQRLGATVAIFLVVLQLMCEFQINERIINWRNVHGIQMVATMKAISFINDMKWQPTKLTHCSSIPTIYAYLGYIFCPTTCILGPWIPYQWYSHRIRYNSMRQVIRCFFQAVMNSFTAIIFLIASNCVIPEFISHFWSSYWFCSWCHMYLDALAVRCSHYFISYLSQAILVLGNHEEDLISKNSSTRATNVLKSNAGISSSYIFGLKVTQILEIEFPRSLHVVVRKWNLPMHHWLKEYVFRNIQATYQSYFVSLLFTYVVSALLHGFHSNIHLVLISLAMFTYVECTLRSALARIYNICITASCYVRKCPFSLCLDKWKRQRLQLETISFGNIIVVYLINGCFAVLTTINLTYLGSMMSGNDESEPLSNGEGVLGKYKCIWRWHTQAYLGHCIHIIMYLFYKLI